MIGSAILRSIIAAAAEDGFSHKLLGTRLVLEGSLRVRQAVVPASIVFDDLALAEPPRLIVSDATPLGRKVIPHLDEDGELCAVDRNLFVLDRYHAAAQTRGLIIRAHEVLERGLTKAATEEIAAEFPRHWSSDWMGIRGSVRNGPASLVVEPYCTSLRPSPAGEEAWFVTTANRLSFDADQGRPSSIGELLSWAGRWDTGLPKRLMEALQHLPGCNATLAISAPNGIVLAQLALQARAGVYRHALARQAGWARLVQSPAARAWPIKRYHGRRVDLGYVLGLNGEQSAPLSEKRVTLIGCGAIGGYLARMLAQNGAGLDGGMLALVDPDRFDHLNVRRHVLGHRSLGQFKAEQCKKLIDDDLPGLSVIARTAPVQSQEGLFEQSSIVIDATGEQSVSEFLNAWMLDRQSRGESYPALLHTSIEGAGAAVRSFISSNTRHACLRCLHPDHEANPRYSALVGPLEEPAAPCGEHRITRYGPAAPVAAAALAVQHAVDWAEGHEMPLLRVVRLSRESTREVKPTSPDAKAQCPACSRAL